MRNGKSRKEFYFSPEEKALITITAKRFHIDESSMVRVLIQLGFESLPRSQEHQIKSNLPGQLFPSPLSTQL